MAKRSSARSKSGGARSKSNSRSTSDGRATTGRRKPAKQEFEDYSVADPAEIPEGPDVLIDVPVVKVDKIEVEVDDLQAQVAVSAEVRNILQLSVGVEAQ